MATSKLPGLLSTAMLGCMVAASSADAQALQFSEEFAVSSNTSNWQEDPRIARTTTGLVVVWHDGAAVSPDVHGRLLALDGTPTGTDFVVNSYTDDWQYRPDVAALAGGGFVVVWMSERNDFYSGQDGSASGVFGQRFDSLGTAVGSEFQVNTYTTGNQYEPAASGLADGGFLVAWSGRGIASGTDVFGQRYDSSGAPVGGEFVLSDYVTGSQRAPSIVGQADGGFMVSWQGEGQGGDGDDVFTRRFDASGTPPTAEFQLNAYTTSFQYTPRLLELASGDLVATWVSVGQDGDLRGVFARVLDSDGTATSSELQVNSYTTDEQFEPAVALLDDGSFVVTWQSGPFVTDDQGQDGDREGIFARRYDAGAAPLGTEFRVNSYWQNPQRSPAVSPDGSNGFVVTWHSTDPQEGLVGSYNVRATRVCLDPSTDTDGDGVGDACDPCNNPGDQTISIKPKLRFKLIGSERTFGNDRMGLTGEFTLPAGMQFADLTPTSTPIGVRMAADTGLVVLDVELPTGTFAGRGTAGWSLNGKGNRWTLRDKTGSPANGIVAAKIKDQSKKTPGRTRIKLKGKNGNYRLNLADQTVNATVLLGDGAAGECVETSFTADGCRFGGLGTRFRCRD